MFRRKVKIKSKRSVKPFQRHYSKDVGSVFTLSTVILMLVLISMFCFMVYGIISAIRM